jgi:hypothetical protein
MAESLADAKERFADAQRAVGERVAAALDQQEIGNRPLRESLEKASRQDDLGTGFLPESPETTADLIAGEQPLAATDASGQQSNSLSANSQQASSQQASSQQASSQQASSQQASSQQASSQQPPGQSGTSGGRDGEARDNGPLQQTAAVDRGSAAGSREGDTSLDEKAFERDAWFAKLPPEVRKAIRADSKRRAPRGYEEKMDRYFKNIE